MSETILTILYIVLSATIVFLPLLAAVPGWIRFVPFYRRALLAVDIVCSRKEEVMEEFPSLDKKSIEKHPVSCIKKGQKANELLSVIKENHEIQAKEVKRIIDSSIVPEQIKKNFHFFLSQIDNPFVRENIFGTEAREKSNFIFSTMTKSLNQQITPRELTMLKSATEYLMLELR